MFRLHGIRDLMFMVSDNELYCTHLKKMYDYLDIPNHMYQGTFTVEKREDNEYYIEFRNVSFKYPRTDNYVLHNVNLKFKIGEKPAVVGMNGSGKTTFIKMLHLLFLMNRQQLWIRLQNMKCIQNLMR
ncbi:MAG: ATP-binding cassette domain-containing protein [Lachnospiraceae bacterium]